MLNRLSDWIARKPYLFLLAVAVLLLKLPPFYLVPTVAISNSSNVIRACVIISFITLLFLRRQRTAKVMAPSGLTLVLTAYLVSQSLSVISAANIGAFLGVYKDLAMGILFLMTILLLEKNEILLLLKVFVASTILSICYQYLFIFYPGLQDLLKNIINYTYLQFVNYQTNRGRYFGDTLDEALIPLLLYSFSVSKKAWEKIGIVIVIIAVIFLVIMASWRTKFLILVAALASSFFLFKRLRRYVIGLLPFFLAVFIIGSVVSVKLVGQNIYDRFLLTDNPTEVLIENNRLSYLKNAWEIGFAHPLTGAGLGNYFDNLSQKNKNANKTSATVTTAKRFILVDDPHNILFSTFAATGFVGLAALLWMLGYFAYTDGILLRKGPLEKALVAVFWGYLIFAFFNPWMYFAFLMPFWFFRGVIENIKLKP